MEKYEILEKMKLTFETNNRISSLTLLLLVLALGSLLAVLLLLTVLEFMDGDKELDLLFGCGSLTLLDDESANIVDLVISVFVEAELGTVCLFAFALVVVVAVVFVEE